ncbi:MAG: hypothetical protein WCQ00_03825 [bacterium]
MPIEFEEYKAGEQMFSPNGRSLGKAPAVKEKRPSSILGFLIALKLAKNEDHAKFILLIVIIIAVGLTMYFGINTYRDFHPDVYVAPIDLNQLK